MDPPPPKRGREDKSPEEKMDVTPENNANNVAPQVNAPTPAGSGRRANFEPNPLDNEYENHPFFNGLHQYLQNNSVHDIWRPSEGEYQSLQNNNSFPCLRPNEYGRQFNSGAPRDSSTHFPSAAEPSEYIHPNGLIFDTPPSGARRVGVSQRSTTFSSAAEQAWHSTPINGPDGAPVSSAPSRANGTSQRPTTTFSSARDPTWPPDNYYEPNVIYTPFSRAPPRIWTQTRRTAYDPSPDRVWMMSDPNFIPGPSRLRSTFGTPVSSTSGTPGTPSNPPFSGTPFATVAAAPPPSQLHAPSSPASNTTFQQQQQRGRGGGGNRSSSSSLGNSMFPHPETPHHPTSLPASPRPSSTRGRGGGTRRRAATTRNSSSIHDPAAGPSSAKSPRF